MYVRRQVCRGRSETEPAAAAEQSAGCDSHRRRVSATVLTIHPLSVRTRRPRLREMRRCAHGPLIRFFFLSFVVVPSFFFRLSARLPFYFCSSNFSFHTFRNAIFPLSGDNLCILKEKSPILALPLQVCVMWDKLLFWASSSSFLNEEDNHTHPRGVK